MSHLRAIIKFLMTLYPDNVKQLGLYGITVVLMPKTAKVRKVKILFGQVKLSVKLILNSIITVAGTEGINIYKGKTVSGTPVLIPAGGKWLTTKGYSIVCIENTSTINDALFSILPK
jgi:hypothetical protein